MPGQTDRQTDHAAKTLLPSSVPELQAYLEAIDHDFLGHKQSPAGGGGVVGVELVLDVPAQEGRLAHTSTPHDHDFGIDATVQRKGVHGGQPPQASATAPF